MFRTLSLSSARSSSSITMQIPAMTDRPIGRHGHQRNLALELNSSSASARDATSMPQGLQAPSG
jgi:hypothetical protein